MRSGFAQYAVLAWLALWFAVIAPGHERGMVRTDGANQRRATPSCCQHPAPGTPGSPETPGSPDKPSKSSKHDAARCCAICYLNATMDVPIAFDLTAMFAGWVERVAALVTTSVYSADPPLSFHGRAPPVATPL